MSPDRKSRRAVTRQALALAFGAPGLVLGASYLGFGSLIRESGLGLWFGLASTATGWALPGQVALVELLATGATLATVGLAIFLVNARLLPMLVLLMPHLREGARPGGRWRYFLLAHFVAITSWANGMRLLPEIAPEHRLRFFATFAITLFAITLAGTAIGYGLAAAVPPLLALGLVFLNPVYFMLVMAADWRQRARALAVAGGAVCGPLLHLAVPDWSLLLTGLGVGTAAFLADRALGGRAE
ncbi:MAG TPA: AzlC family ABC transporter permease [Alphaproteobacteria bacterium]|nr:AzlC family ABC transporter permease [Alphaproteobacteria bacterium]